MTDRLDIAIVGPGVVGTTLGILAARAGWRVAGVAGRSAKSARAAADAIAPGVRTGSAEQVAPAGGLVLLTVPDDEIEPLCRRLARVGALARGGIVAHLSGALSSEVLAPARALCGSAIGSMHPLQTFPSVRAGVERFAGTYCFCEDDERAVAALSALAEAIGARPVRISPAAKPLYHAAAVMACNYLAALVDAALALAEAAGIARDDALPALEPLLRATLDHVTSAGPAAALTGPIARGDARIVARQVRDVDAADDRLGRIYRALGDWTVELARRKGSIYAAAARRLRKALSRARKPDRA
jgi:predicted short-subunit dehydrogenase-like oxidoreductase (DUF2520 family)